MIRAVAIVIALLTTAPAFADDLVTTHSETPALEAAAATVASKPKRKPVKAETADYLVVTLKEASITSY